MKVWTLLWGVWVTFFAVVEYLALRRKGKGDTFTEQIKPTIQNHKLLWMLSAAGWLWVGLHFLAPLDWSF